MLSETVIIVGNGIGNPGSNPKQNDVSLHANALGKGINLSVPSLTMGK